MMITSYKNIFKDNNFIQLSVEFSSIFFIASLFDKYTTFIDNILKTKTDFVLKNKFKDVSIL